MTTMTETNPRGYTEITGGARPMIARWVICGALRLDTATHTGGEAGLLADMIVIRDTATNRPLLTGESLAGALRNALNDRLKGYFANEEHPDAARLLGGASHDPNGDQSPLIVFDSPGELPENAGFEIRDGVAIVDKTGIAEDKKKFDFEVIPAGTIFNIRFELIVPDAAGESKLLALLAAALESLESGLIRIGARKTRGLGRCHVEQWQAIRYNLATDGGWRDWLKSEHLAPIPVHAAKLERCIIAAMFPAASADFKTQWTALPPDKRRRCLITLDLKWPAAGLLIRNAGARPGAPDVAHIQSSNNNILPGTSVAGALRKRARRIINTLADAEPLYDRKEALALFDKLFGPEIRNEKGFQPRMSRLGVDEAPRISGMRLQPIRICVNRFTGAPLTNALLEEEPLYKGAARVTLDIKNHSSAQTGLALLAVKDLLTGDLPLGGTTGVGRGAVSGAATIEEFNEDAKSDPIKWAPNESLDKVNAEKLNGYVSEFIKLFTPDQNTDIKAEQS